MTVNVKEVTSAVTTFAIAMRDTSWKHSCNAWQYRKLFRTLLAVVGNWNEDDDIEILENDLESCLKRFKRFTTDDRKSIREDVLVAMIAFLINLADKPARSRYVN